jgi:hypothetical protein
MARICHFLHQFSELCRDRDPHPDATPEAIEADLQELLHLLDEEIAALPPEIEHAEKVHAERVALERDACLAPEGETWRVMLRQESSLDRSIDRKVKIILGMRKTCFDDSKQEPIVGANLAKGDAPEMEDIEPTLEYDIVSEIPTLEPPDPQNARNKPGMSMKTKSSRKMGSEPEIFQATTNLEDNGENASGNVAA